MTSPATPHLPPLPHAGSSGHAPSLRVVLVEVGEEQLAGAGLAALRGQVHGASLGPRPAGEGERLSLGSSRPRSAPAASSSLTATAAPCLRSGSRRSLTAPAPSRPLPHNPLRLRAGVPEAGRSLGGYRRDICAGAVPCMTHAPCSSLSLPRSHS